LFKIKTMQSTPLFQLLKALTKSDRRDLAKFLRSPFHNTREDVVLLFDFFEENVEQNTTIDDEKSEKGDSREGGTGSSVYSAFLSEKSDVLTKQAAHQFIFSENEPFDDATIRYAMSFLLKLTKQFLIHKELKDNDLQQDVLLAKALRKRGAIKTLEKHLEQTTTVLSNTTVQNGAFHLLDFQLQLEIFEHRHRRRDAADLNLQALSDGLNQFYATELLRWACVQFSHSSLSKVAYEQPFLTAVLEKIGDGTFKGDPSVSAYFFAYRALKFSQEADFQQLKTTIIENAAVFPPAEIRDLYLLAINVCIKKLNSGDNAYAAAALDLYRNGLSNGALLDDGVLSPYTYKNVANLAIKIGETTWATDFLNDFKGKLPIKERENLFRYNLANLHFRKNDYPKAMELLRDVQLKEALQNLDARRMLLRMYYETGEFAALDSLLESFKTFIHRQKNLGYHRENYLNLVKLTRKLLQTDVKNRKEADKLRKEIDATTALTERDWLLSQIKN
jgi:hypothetical protein